MVAKRVSAMLAMAQAKPTERIPHHFSNANMVGLFYFWPL